MGGHAMVYDFHTARIVVDFTCECGKVAHLTGQLKEGTTDSFIVTCPELFDKVELTIADVQALKEACDIMLDKLPDLPDN